MITRFSKTAFAVALISATVLLLATQAVSSARLLDVLPIAPDETDSILVPNEQASVFDLTRFPAVIPQGVARFTVEVPKAATGKHGVGIDGGIYQDIDGVPVGPGRATSLTIYLKPGTYTVYDSYKDNRAKGFAANVTVYPKDDFGVGCRIKNAPALAAATDALRIARTSCKTAQHVASEIYRWQTAPGFRPAILRIGYGHFRCSFAETTAGPEYAKAVRADCKRRDRGWRHSATIRFTYRVPSA